MPRPTDAECAQLRAQALQQRDGAGRFIRQALPIREDQLHYLKWVSAQANAKRQPLSELPHDELARNISLANFFKPDHLCDLHTLLVSPRLRPVPLGHSPAGNRYRLVPSPLELPPHELDRRTKYKPEARPSPNPGTLLCLRSRNQPYVEGSDQVNIAPRVSTSARVARNASGQSVISIPSTDSGYGGSDSGNSSLTNNFIFHQLGPIEWHPPKASNPDEDSHDWRPTGFVLVVSAGSNGQPTNNLYAVLDLFPPADPNFDQDDRIDEPMSNWSREKACRLLAGTSEPFSCARLDRVSGLGDCDRGFGTRLWWTDRIKGAIDLLHVKLP